MHAGGMFSFVPGITSARSAGAAIIELIDSTPEIDAESVIKLLSQAPDTRGLTVPEADRACFPGAGEYHVLVIFFILSQTLYAGTVRFNTWRNQTRIRGDAGRNRSGLP